MRLKMPVMHFVLNSKRGSGKTFIAWLLAQYKMDNSQPIKIIDCDPNLEISKFRALKAKSLNLMKKQSDGSIVYDFEPVINLMKSSYSDLLFDFNSEEFNTVVNALRKDDCYLLEQLSKLEIQLVVHMPVSGIEYARADCISSINEVLSTIPNLNVVVWLNHYPKPLFDDELPSTELFYTMFTDKGKLRYIVNLPQITKADTITRENDFKLLTYMLKEKRIFAEILDPYRYKFAANPSLNGVPVFILTDYQIAFLRDDFEKEIDPIAEIVF